MASSTDTTKLLDVRTWGIRVGGEWFRHKGRVYTNTSREAAAMDRVDLLNHADICRSCVSEFKV